MSERPLDLEEIKWILDELADLYNIPVKRILLDFKEIILKEIDKAIGYYTIQNALNESTFRNEKIEGLKIAKELIRKYFLDVKENENERAD